MTGNINENQDGCQQFFFGKFQRLEIVFYCRLALFFLFKPLQFITILLSENLSEII